MSLRQFLEGERSIDGQVTEVAEEVSADFEAPAVMKANDGGPVVVFRRIKGHRGVAVAGICGTRERIYRAIGAGPRDYYSKLIDAAANPVEPEEVASGPVTEVSCGADLGRIPVFRHYERDAGRYITSGIVVARSANGRFQNASIHRLLVLGRDRLAIRLVPRHLYAMHQEAKSRGEDLQVAVVIGVHPALAVGANVGPKLGVDELGVGNALLGGGLKVVRCRRAGVAVPADAEIVLEGVIKADEVADEGPFVDLTGTYDIVRKQPVVQLTGMMMRGDAIYQAILPGGAEHKLLMGMPKEARMYDAVSKAVPDVRGVRLTLGGACWFHAAVSIRKQAEGDGKNAILAALGANPSVKHVVVVDEDIDVDDPAELEWAIATRFQGDSGIIKIRGARGSSLDPSSDQERILTAKVGIDATVPWGKPREKFEKAAIPKTAR